MRRLNEVAQRHHLTVQDRDLILDAHRGVGSVEPNGTTPLEGSLRIAWERRLT